MVYMYHSFIVHSSADGHLGCFHVLAMTNSAAMNIGVHVSLSDLVSLVCMPRSGIALLRCTRELRSQRKATAPRGGETKADTENPSFPEQKPLWEQV